MTGDWKNAALRVARASEYLLQVEPDDYPERERAEDVLRRELSLLYPALRALGHTCGYCNGRGWRDEGDPEIGSAPMDCSRCVGTGIDYTAAPQPKQESEAVAERIAAWQPGTWFKAQSADEMQAFYASRLPAIREAARDLGYAIGLHGSMRRDLDLIAAPWREDAADAKTLAHAVQKAACGMALDGSYQWTQKPLGRIATSMACCWTWRHHVTNDGHIDLSVMPAAQAEGETLDAIAHEFERCIPTRDGKTLAGMIRAGVTALESHIHYAMQAEGGRNWIACSERMPEVGEQVLVWLRNPPGQGCSHLNFDCWDEQHESPVSWSSHTIPVGLGWDSGTDWHDITHWRPLPDEPAIAAEQREVGK